MRDTALPSFGQWLSRRRRALDLTQEDLAAHLACSGSLIRKLESDQRPASPQMAQALADFLKVVPDERDAFVQFAKGRLSGDAAQRKLWHTLHSRAGRTHPTNLPAPLTALIGREQELKSLVERILSRNDRLVTVTGPPGVGKTSLAVEAGTRLLDHFEDGVFFVSLAPINNPDLVPPAIAQTLGVQELGELSALEGLVQFLREKHLLLLLDNFEQVLDAAPFVLELLGAAPHLKVLTTSREALHVHGEQQFAVSVLEVPPADDKQWVLKSYSAVELFVERAMSVRPDFALTQENAEAVAAICARLDGLPLAIELAAARVRLFSPQEIRTRLESLNAGQDLAMLTSKARNLPARQRTLRNAIEWSYNLLNEVEAMLFARLSVFVGGSTLAAIEAICNPQGDLGTEVLDALDSLVAKSLVKQDNAAAGESRYTMLEMIGNYASELLAGSEEEEVLRQLHAEYYLALAVAGEQALSGSSQKPWLIRLEADHDNLRAALRWALERAEVELALHLSGSLWRFWELHGHLREGRQWLAKALSMSTERTANQDHSVPRTPYSQRARAKALFAAGRLAERQGDNASALPLLEEGAAMAREIDDRPLLALILHNLANLASYNEDYIAGRRLAEESLALRTEMGDRLGMANTLHNLGFQAEAQGDYTAAGAYFDQSLTISREVQDAWGIAYSLDALALIRLEQGDDIPAHSLLTESLALRRDLGDKSGIARSNAWQEQPPKLGNPRGLLGSSGQRRRCVSKRISRSCRWTVLSMNRRWPRRASGSRNQSGTKGGGKGGP